MVKKKRRPVTLHRERQPQQSGGDGLVNKALVMQAPGTPEPRKQRQLSPWASLASQPSFLGESQTDERLRLKKTR